MRFSIHFWFPLRRKEDCYWRCSTRFGIGRLTNCLHGLIEYWECLMRLDRPPDESPSRIDRKLEWNSLLRSCLKLCRAAILPAGCVLQEPWIPGPSYDAGRAFDDSFGYSCSDEEGFSGVLMVMGRPRLCLAWPLLDCLITTTILNCAKLLRFFCCTHAVYLDLHARGLTASGFLGCGGQVFEHIPSGSLL